MCPWAICFFLLLAMVSKASCMEENMAIRACASTPYVDACLSHIILCRGPAVRPCTMSQLLRYTIRVSRELLAHATNWASSSLSVNYNPDRHRGVPLNGIALRDCVHLYEDSKYRLQQLRLLHGRDDALTWLSAALTNHRACLDGLRETGSLLPRVAENLTASLSIGLALYASPTNETDGCYTVDIDSRRPDLGNGQGLVMSWDAAKGKADFVVAKDGSGNYRTIKEAVAALAQRGRRRLERVVIYVKSGVYVENVEISRDMKNVMFVGDGMDKTIVTSNRNVRDGATTFGSATFGVSGDGFWARDITFENTAGPEKHQAVALMVGSDYSAFYRCSFRGYQDTLLVHSQRQFYRDCHVHGTVDFIFGNAAAVFQNCNLYVRRPMGHQSNMITAQGREDPNENTGISIHQSRILPALDFQEVKGSFKSYLGRPWKKYSRTVFMKTDLNSFINPRGWTEWRGNFALSTLYYGEYMNSGVGASTGRRVKWPGFHVLKDPRDADPFTVARFIQGNAWIPSTGMPFLPGL